MGKYKVEITGINTSELKVLTQEEMTELFKKYKEDDKLAKDELVNGNLKLVLSILKRFNKEDNKIVYGSIKINLDEKTVYVNEESVEFTALEFKILVLMFTNIGKVITREQILEKIWDVAGNFVNDNTLTVYIKRIRTKLGKMDCIKTIKGIGYQVQGGQK